MATSLISTGVQFADSTIQTTAAVAGGGSAEIVASGSLSNGSKVVINADGTVSVVGPVAVDPPVVGTPVVFESAETHWVSSCFDSANNKVVVAYMDQPNSSYGTAVVGTVSGTSISFGTPVVFVSAPTSWTSCSYDSSSDVVVIAFTGSFNYGRAVVGTISGTSISFGSPVNFDTTSSSTFAAVYDTANNKTVIAYRDEGNSFYGTAIVGTVSGTSISFGSEVVFVSANVQYISAAFDSTSNKIVITYRDNGNLGYGTAIVGTVSGTSISFGTAAVFESASTRNMGVVYDTSNSKAVVAYRDNGNSDYLTAVVGTVSGTGISFGSPVASTDISTEYVSASYDSTNDVVVISYQDAGNSNYGTAVVATVSGTSVSFGTPVVYESANPTYISSTYDSNAQKTIISFQGVLSYGRSAVLSTSGTNLTTENFIGISDAAYTNGQTATIQLAGAVDDAQTSLTAGQSYFVQPDGTLGLTPGTPSVFAGTAVSSTKLIIKG